MFVTRQQILSHGPEIIVCETNDYCYMVKEVIEGFSIHFELWNPDKARFLVARKKKAFWVGDHTPPDGQIRYEWCGSWVGGAT